MDSTPLHKDMISQPELWKLSLLIGRRSLDVALFPPIAREEMIWRSYAFDPAAASRMQAIEDIIYDNPLLLADFKAVECIIDDAPQILLPAALPAADLELLYRQSTAAEPDTPVEAFSTADPSCCIALAQSPDVRSFLTRTFFNITFDSHIAALCRYFRSAHSESGDPDPDLIRFFAVLRSGRLSLIAFQGTKLLIANTFATNSDADSAYYILACIHHLGADPRRTHLYIGGSGITLGPLAEMLRKYLPDVAPLPFPTLRYRASRNTLQAPVDLLIRPLCE